MPLTLFQAWKELEAADARAQLYRAWGAGLEAGMTHSQTLEALGACPHRLVERQRRGLLRGLAEGLRIGDVARGQPADFLLFEIALLQVGERTGLLGGVLSGLASWFAQEGRALRRARQHLRYPLALALCACLLLPVPLMRTSIPAYFAVFLGGTAACLGLSGGMVLALARLYNQRPVLVARRFALALALASEVGLEGIEGLDLAVAAADAPRLTRWWRDRRRSQERSLAALLRGAPRLPAELLALAETGERTGRLPELMMGFGE